MSDKLFQILIVIGLFIASAVCLCAAVAIVYGLSWLCMWFCNSFMNPSEPIGVGLGFVGLLFCIFMFIGYTSLLKGA